MAGFPEPEAGLVISYSYLWKEEEERGQTEGRKDRPCAIVLAVDDPDPKADGRKQVAVAPITHSPPHDLSVAVEIPLRVKEHLGLDSERSWVILEEVNIFERLIAKFRELRAQGKVAGSSRDEPMEPAPAKSSLGSSGKDESTGRYVLPSDARRVSATLAPFLAPFTIAGVASKPKPTKATTIPDIKPASLGLSVKARASISYRRPQKRPALTKCFR